MKKTIIFLLVAILFLGAFLTTANAKATLPKIEVVKGKIEAIGNNSIKVSGKDIKISGDTAIRLNGKIVALTDLKVGLEAIAVCEVGEDKTLNARLILAFDVQSIKKEFTVVGEVKEVSQNSIVVGDKKILVDASTKIRKGKDTVSLTDVKVGDRVVVHGTYDQGNLVAKEILIISPKELEIRSYITEIGTDFIKVKDFNYQIYVNSETRITKVGKGKVSLTDLKVGDPVEVHARISNENYVATSIVVLAFKPNTAVVVGGTISAIDTEAKTLKLTELPLLTFKFSNDYKGKIKITDLKVGDKVLIFGKYVDVSTIEIQNIVPFKLKISPPKEPNKKP